MSARRWTPVKDGYPLPSHRAEVEVVTPAGEQRRLVFESGPVVAARPAHVRLFHSDVLAGRLVTNPSLEFDAGGQRGTKGGIELTRVGTCMAWQWMCPNFCGYVLGINADREAITALAARHLGQCRDA